jgi:hypothetical protein
VSPRYLRSYDLSAKCFWYWWDRLVSGSQSRKPSPGARFFFSLRTAFAGLAPR